MAEVAARPGNSVLNVRHPVKDAQTPSVWWHFKWIEELLGSVLSGRCELSTITMKEGKKRFGDELSVRCTSTQKLYVLRWLQQMRQLLELL